MLQLQQKLEESGKATDYQKSTRSHPCQTRPCQLLLLALHTDITRKLVVLLGHEMLTVIDPPSALPNDCKGSVTAKEQ